ncbi:MAG: hypothetical protein ACR2FO_08110 [Actinomycetota bacterium]
MNAPRGFYRVVVLAWIVLSGCTPNIQQALPAGPVTVNVSMSEYRFDYRPPAESGRVIFRVVNEGAVQHEIRVVRIPKELLPIDQQIRGSKHSVAEHLRSSVALDPGQDSVFALDLAPGRYGLICFIPGPEAGSTHAFAGMTSEFRIGG